MPSSSFHTLTKPSLAEQQAAFESYRAEMKVSTNNLYKTKMCYHIFLQYGRSLGIEYTLSTAYNKVCEQIDALVAKNPYYLDASSVKTLKRVLKEAICEYREDIPSEKIKRSFLVELAAESAAGGNATEGDPGEDTTPEDEAKDDVQQNDAVSADAPKNKLYHEMKLHDSVRMVIEGYYREAVDKIQASCEGTWWSKL